MKKLRLRKCREHRPCEILGETLPAERPARAQALGLARTWGGQRVGGPRGWRVAGRGGGSVAGGSHSVGSGVSSLGGGKLLEYLQQGWYVAWGPRGF